MTALLRSSDPGIKELVILGAGGHGRELAWLARQCYGPSVDVFFAVTGPEYLSNAVAGIPIRVMGDVAPNEKSRYIVALGDPSLRRMGAGICVEKGFLAGNLVHPWVEVAETVTLGPGSVVCAGSILTVNLQFGAHAHINVGCSVIHDAVIGDFCTLSQGERVCGNVRIGEGVFIGLGATIIDGRPGDPLVIGDGEVSAGACVTRSVEEGAVMVGIPATSKR